MALTKPVQHSLPGYDTTSTSATQADGLPFDRVLSPDFRMGRRNQHHTLDLCHRTTL